MSFKQLILLTYALTAGALAIGLTSDYTKALKFEYAHARSELKASAVTKIMPAPTEPVVTLVRDLEFGHRLTASDLEVQQWPMGSAPKNGYKTVGAFLAAFKRPHASSELFKGEPVLPTKIKEAANSSALALLLPPDRRAVTIPINEVRGVGGFVKPRDRVDIILTEKKSSKEDKKAPPRTSKVLLQDIQILAVGQDTKLDENKPKVASSVTVAVTLDEAQKLALATTVGYLSLALRGHSNQDSAEKTAPQKVSLDDIKNSKGSGASGYMRVVIHRSAGERVVITKGSRVVQ